MPIRLTREKHPSWVDIGRGAALFCQPPTAILVQIARARTSSLIVDLKQAGLAVTKLGGQITGTADLSDTDAAMATSEALLTIELAELAATAWRGVLDEDGHELAFASELLAILLSDAEAMMAFRNNYLHPLSAVQTEGNG